MTIVQAGSNRYIDLKYVRVELVDPNNYIIESYTDLRKVPNKKKEEQLKGYTEQLKGYTEQIMGIPLFDYEKYMLSVLIQKTYGVQEYGREEETGNYYIYYKEIGIVIREKDEGIIVYKKPYTELRWQKVWKLFERLLQEGKGLEASEIVVKLNMDLQHVKKVSNCETPEELVQKLFYRLVWSQTHAEEKNYVGVLKSKRRSLQVGLRLLAIDTPEKKLRVSIRHMHPEGVWQSLLKRLGYLS